MNLSNILRPVNFLDELDAFITAKGRYNPRFAYKRPTEERLKDIEKEVRKLQTKYFGTTRLESKFGTLFLHKLVETQKKLEFVHAYKSQDLEMIQKMNIELYGEVDMLAFEQAKDELKE